MLPDPPLALTQVLGKLDLSNLKYLAYVLLGWWLSRRAVGAPGPVGMRGGFSGLRRPHGLWQPAALLAHGEPTGWFNDYFGLPILLASCCVFCFCLTFRGLEPPPHWAASFGSCPPAPSGSTSSTPLC